MDDGGPIASIIFFVVLVLTDMLFYGFGSAIQYLNGGDIEKRAAEEKDAKSVRLQKIMENPTQFVNTVQLVVTLINLIMGGFYLGLWLKEIQYFLETDLSRAFKPVSALSPQTTGMISLVVTMAVLIYILLTFGVLVPKRIASRYPEKWAYAFVNPIYFMTGLLSPLTGAITHTTNGLLVLCGMKGEGDVADVTEEEIISMVNEGHEQGVLLASEAEMITNIFEFGDKEAEDIMTQRSNIIGIESGTFLKEAIHFMLQERNSRYPVYEENIDHVIGIIHLKDALRIHASDEAMDQPVRDIDGLIREAEFVPETKNIDALFQYMQSKKIQMVVVIDEYGQTAGLVAMEDILEEIVGNIMDEYDEDEDYIEEKGKDEYVIEGMTPLDELEERLGIDLEENEFDTLNGFLISKMDKIQEEDEEFEIDVCGYNFKVLSVESKMIHSVLVTKLPEESREEEPVTETP